MSLLAVQGGATGTGTVTLLAPVTNTDRTLTLPDATGTVLDSTGGTTQTALTVTNGASIQGLTVGRGAGAVSSNTAVGASALAANTTGKDGVAIGNLALRDNTTGIANLAIGSLAMITNTTGGYNTAIGNGEAGVSQGALGLNTTGSNNTGVGYQALRSNTTASRNTAVGFSSATANTTGTRNTGVGAYSLYVATTGNFNTAIGDVALEGLTTGSSNTAIGIGSGGAITTGSKNTIIGGYTGNQGGLDIRTASNNIVLSDGDGNPRGYFDSSGRMLINTTTAQARLTVLDAGDWVIASMRTGTGGEGHIRFDNANGNVGSIQTSGSSTSYVTSSDYRLKNTVAPMTGALEKVALLKPVTYKWNVDGSDGESFIAHELAEVCPQAVTGEKDEIDKDGNPKYQGIDTSFLVATLTAAIQELNAKVDAQAAEIAALKGTA